MCAIHIERRDLHNRILINAGNLQGRKYHTHHNTYVYIIDSCTCTFIDAVCVANGLQGEVE